MKKIIKHTNSRLKFVIFSLLLVVPNYLIYFKLSPVAVILVLCTSIGIFLILNKMPTDKILFYFILLFILYPKKPISIEWTNYYLSELIEKINFKIGLSFFDFFIIPHFSLVLFFKAIKKGHNNIWYRKLGFVFMFFFILSYSLSILINPSLNTQHSVQSHIFATLIFSSQLLLIPVVLIYENHIIKYRNLFENLIIYFLMILLLEFVLGSLGFLPGFLMRQSFDYREGFRSIFLGYSVDVGFYAFLGFSVALLRYLKEKRLYYILLAMVALILQTMAFDRAPMLASVSFVCLILIRNYKKMFIIVSLFIFSLGLLFNNAINESVNSSKVGSLKTGGMFGMRSTYDRIGIQIRYLDAIINNSFLPAGLNTNNTFFSTEIKRNFISQNKFINATYSNTSSIGLTQSHNLLVQLFFETGLVCFILYLIILRKYFKLSFKMKDTSYFIFGFSLLIYYMFQATPTYYFLPLMIFIFSKSNITNIPIKRI